MRCCVIAVLVVRLQTETVIYFLGKSGKVNVSGQNLNIYNKINKDLKHEIFITVF